ncbi:hypothetical protein F4779DRAFT_642004 [Xylariaceae sp. FL0662B]|nr:hypothetical protein F4779DRAFT_642004 [Xylariaceae sp. FL0662B]
MGVDIAIVGFSFKLPQDVNDVSSLWETLTSRKSLMTKWPESRINAGSFGSNGHSKVNCRGGYFINEDLGAFDAPFFSVTAKEAASMDPMQRWTLEASYRAFENAGIPAESLRGSRTGVFSASMTDDYKRMIAQDPDNVPRMAVTGTFASIIPNRVSWYFDLRGPSIHVDSACSSSLLAVDLACQSLRTGEASSAIVTGSNLILGPTIFQMLSALNFLSPDSKCYSFDHRANGYARGEGIIALVLKPLPDAVRDGDMIRAVIRSTGSNQDGNTPGLTQPSPRAQEELIRQVYTKANLPFDLTRYFEAHGTGTPVGDPIEMKAIGRVFRTSRSPKEPLYVGSVKSNIGHLEGSSGLAGILKSILILEKGIIVPNANFERISPNIDAGFYHLEVPTESITWPSEGLRRVSVNSFGFGGTNVHVIMDDAFHYLQERGLIGNHHTIFSIPSHGISLSPNGVSHPREEAELNGVANLLVEPVNGISNGTKKRHESVNGTAHSKPRLLVWSAADKKALERMIRAYEIFSQGQQASDSFEDLAFTLAARRNHMLWRSFAIGSSSSGTEDHSQDATFKLSAVKPIRSSADTGIAFVFTGQGAQYVDMGLGLLEYPVFETTLKEIDAIYGSLGCKWSIFDELRNKDNIDRPEYSQPISTALQIGLVELLKSFGVTPKAVVGHSSGEIAAAYTVGALSLLSACKVSYFRGQVTGNLRAASRSSPEAMMSVNLPEEEIQGYLESVDSMHAIDIAAKINIACINSPLNCTLSGDESALDVVKAQLDRDGIFAQKLKTGVAYHSPSMCRIVDEYVSLMGSLDGGNSKGGGVKVSSIPIVSSVTGQAIRASLLATPQYWVDNMVSPVRFADAMLVLTQKTSMLKVGIGQITDLVEVGPHPALRRPVKDTLTNPGEGRKQQQMRYTYVLHRSCPPIQTMLELLGQLFCHGHTVSIPAVNHQEKSKTSPPQSFLVDCPEYPFDHSKTYWAESRLSRDFRLRDGVVGETLGWRSFDWNPLEPRWRNFLSVESAPWIGDHVVNDTVIYPAAGMLMMAIEAVRDICPAHRTLAGYHVKEAHFISPLLVRETWEDKTEVMLRLRPIQSPHEKDSTWSDISIYAYSNDCWTECFRAKIQVEYEEESATLGDLKTERQRAHERVLSQYKQAMISCTRPIDAEVFYDDAAEHGLQYGKAFQVLQDIRWDGKADTLARVDVSKLKHTASLVHPVVLDAAFHALRVSTTLGLSLSSATNVPVRLVDAWFAPSAWQHPQTSAIQYFATSEVKGGRESEKGTIYAIADDCSVLCSMRRVMTAAVSRRAVENDQATKKLLYNIEWKPQLSLLEPQQLVSACGADILVRNEEMMLLRHEKLSFVLDKVCVRILKQLSGANRLKVPKSQERHIEWLEHHIKQLPASRISGDVGEVELEDMLQEIEALHPPWKLHTTVVRRLPSILTGGIDPLEVIFGSNLADVFYADMFENVCDDRMFKFLDLATHENPGLRILEVGAGTGGMTSCVLGSLEELEKQSGALKFSEYTYTDVSPAFFERAKNRWQHGFQGRMTFKTFDMKSTPETQGFDPHSYDLVIAGSVLHATEELMATMRNVRRALKPGGHLLILEVINPQDVVTNFTFGLVPGWWGRREEWRGLSPAITEKQWDGVLRETGFTGNDACFRDYQNDVCHIFSMIVSTATAEDNSLDSLALKPSEPILVVDSQSDHQQTSIANLIHGAISTQSQSHSQHEEQARIFDLEQALMAPLIEDSNAICIIETLNRPFFATLSEETFNMIREFVRRTQRIMWVTSTSVQDTQYAQYSVMEGFWRSIRAEAPDKHIVTLAIESQGSETMSTAECAQYVTKAYKAAFESTSTSKELEYVVRNGQLTTGRAAESVVMNSTLHSLLHPQLQSQPLSSGPPLKLRIGAVGTLDALQLVEDTAVHQTVPLRPHEVEIEAKAWGLNFRDVLCALGRLEDRELGLDCAGVVTRVAPDCDPSANIRPGDRVCMISIDCMRTHPRARDNAVLRIPDNLSFETAVSVLIPGMTAYHSLIEVARLRKSDKILIHSAAGATGQMAVWIAKQKGAEIFATVGSDEKKEFLIDRFGIPGDHIFCSRNTSFAQGIMRMTEGYGVDVVLNSLSGDGLRSSWECMAPFGRFVEIGAMDIKENSALPMATFARNVSFAAIDLRHIILTDEELTSNLLQSTIKLLAESEIQNPNPLHVYPVSKVEQAFRDLMSGKSIGRAIISVDGSDVVPKHLMERRSWTFDGNASYLLAGGLGGLGRAVMKWMAERGAKYLIVPSRSSGSSTAAAETISKLTEQGVHVFTPKCDVSCAESLESLLRDCALTMPPIRGCINCAMVLQDAVFENMTYAQWDLTIKSKVQTSLNLDRLLPDSLDFFILLSSLNGVCGALAQSNYAAGCSFQDALARHRVARGQQGVSIDIGWMRNIGIVAETQSYQRQRRSWDDMQKIDDTELLALLSVLCDPSTSQPLPSQTSKTDGSQVLFGLRTPADFLVQGQTPPALLTRPLFASFSHILGDAAQRQGARSDAASAADYAAAFREATADSSERIQIVIRALAAKLARSMSISPDDVELNKPLSSYGVDSLMAVELRNWITRDFGASVTVFDIMGNVPVAAIGDLVVAKSTVGKS